MSTPATATFLEHWRNHARRVPISLALIEISTPTPVTLRVATREVTTPDGETWEAGLKADAIRATVGQLDPGPSPADTAIYLANRLYPFMSSGAVVDTLADYQWQGAVVTLYRWNDVRDSTGAQELAWADALQFGPWRVDAYQAGDNWLKLSLLQDQSWNNPVPDVVVDNISYPNAQDSAQGLPIPIVYGSHIGLPLRSPHTAAYTNKLYQEDAGAGSGAVPGIVVDAGLGAANLKVLYAGHLCADILSRSTGYTQFIVGNDVLAPLNTTGITEVLGAAESYITIDDDTLLAFYGVRPLEPRAAINTATNARRAANPFDETSYATVQQPANGVLELSLPSLGSLGFIETVEVICCFSGDAANANTFRVRPQVPGGASGTAITSTLGQAQTATPVIISGTWDAASWTQNWQFGGDTATVPRDVKCEFTGGVANVARVYWVALRVKYRPQRSVVTPSYVDLDRPRRVPVLERRGLLIDMWEPAKLRVDGQFFGNIKGYADDGGGTYTGTASALIERPCDIAAHFLVTYGGVSLADIETGATSFGSFVAARDLLRNGAPSDYKLAAWIGQKTSVQRTLQDIAAQSLSCILLDVHTGNWMFHPWRRGPATDYDLALARTELPDLFECGVLSDVGLAQGIRVRWAMDYFKGRTLFETFVNAEGSSQGYALPTVRDQAMTVDATNEDIDWRTGVISWSGGTLYAATLAHGTYTPIDLAEEIQGKIRAADGGVVVVGHGFSVKTGFNDTWVITRTAVPYNVVLAEGDYTADTLAQEAARALNAAGIPGTGTWTCTYAHTTNLFTVTCGATVSWGNFFLLGMYAAAGGTSATSAVTRYADRFYFANALMIFGWLSGTSAATNCAELVGYTRLADQSIAPGGGNPLVTASLARNQREVLCAASEAAFGPRADMEVVAPWVRDESSAQRLRDGIFDFGSTPPVWVKFRSHSCPDLRRMQIFELDSDMDNRRAYPGYGTDGSWRGKRFRVLEIEYDMGPSFHDEVYALEA